MVTYQIIYPPLPIDYGCSVEWTDEADVNHIGSVYGFSGLDKNGQVSNALVELPDGTSVEVSLSNLRLIDK